ncbi:MAG: hypothetical protein ABW022_25775 [Actinoplanes sp.]
MGVPLWTALGRSTAGFAYGVVCLLGLSWVGWSDGYLTALLTALLILHRDYDRHARRAIVAAGLAALPITLGLAVLLKGWLPQPWSDIVFAAVGALAGGCVYAYATGR